jgi:hypothetical protein
MEGFFATPWFWLVIVGGGALLIGVFMAVGQARNKNMTPEQKVARDVGTRQIYAEDESKRRSGNENGAS